jgi:hypothetical protein
VRTLDPALVVLHTVDPDQFDRHAEDIRGLVNHAPVAMPAARVAPERIAAAGARPLPGDIIAAARAIAP